MTVQSAAQDVAEPGSLLAGLDITVVEAGPATLSRRCSTDNGCDTLANGDC
ncbi:FxLD family lantipeptide [Sinosporangium album]|uniref:FxLD family lantipeptide n=1 Tax=Sinosporangium album TaxID=504805 RepID=A0A1G7WTI3_9ACTN|nr:hypothetical protein [Sinosporangium album]SDG75232.1 FxLD family lantipeptide [Sinosporangium album]